MSDNPKPPDTINFDYLKSGQFRVVHADGAFVSLSQTGVNVSFFTERQAIPRRVVHKVDAHGIVGEEITSERVVRDAIVRDVEISVMMTTDSAERLIDVLQKVVKSYKEIAAQKKQGKG